jgi:hypothetical protein
MDIKQPFVIVIIAILFLGSCRKAALSPSQYVSYIKDPSNGFIITKDLHNYDFKAFYQPEEYVTLKEFRNAKLSKEEFLKVRKNFANQWSFDLCLQNNDSNKIQLNKPDSLNNKRLDYFSFNINQDVFLIINEDTLKCSLHHYERNFGISPEEHFLFAFAKNKTVALPEINKMELLYYDKILGVGNLSFEFDIKKLLKNPSIKI